MSIPEWGADRPLDETVVRTALTEALPDLDATTLQPIASGWDFDVWALDLKRIARFPRRKDVVATTRREVRFMPLANDALEPLGVETPEVLAVGEPTDAFPYPFLVQRRLWGLPLDALKLERFSPRLTRHVGEIVNAIHRMECTPDLLEDPSDYTDDTLERALELTARLPDELAERIPEPLEWLRAEPTPPAPYRGPPRVIHNDLSPQHIRIARNGLTVLGLLDWSDVTTGDPARDFAPLYCWGGPDAVRKILSGYAGEGDGLLERTRYFARLTALPRLQEAVERDGDTQKHLGWVEQAFTPD